MDRKVKSFRLRTDLLSWVESYARKRKSSQVAVLEEAVESFRRDCEGGVPDIQPKPEWKAPPAGTATYAQVLGQRQKLLAKEMGWDK